MPMREQSRIGALVDDAMRFIADNRERLIQAWIAETGCLPSESLPTLVEAIARDVERLPLDIGTAIDTGGEETQCRMCGWPLEVHALAAQADALKAAVDKANNRAADAFRAWVNDVGGPFYATGVSEFEAWLRSGEDAPGAVEK